MAITRTQTKACCGSGVFLFESSKPIRKAQVQVFRDAGYLVPEDWIQRGLFWVKKGNMIVTASYGSSTFQVRCYGEACPNLLDSFEADLEQAINS